jgi:sugar phosphate isomerase/epimerase
MPIGFIVAARASGTIRCMKRRTFLLSSLAAAVTSSLPSVLGSTTQRIGRLGLQLYTVRNLLESNAAATLAKVAAAGYKEVECAGYFGLSPKQARAAIDAAGLVAPSGHIDFKTLTAAFAQALEAANIVGHRFLVNSWIEEEVRYRSGGWAQVVEALNRAGEAARKTGVQLAYHNYWADFQPLPDGTLPYDFLLKECDPKLVVMEMDLCWVSVGGADPVDYFHRYPGRFRMVHIKDVKRLPKPSPRQGAVLTAAQVLPDMTDVGSGIIDWKRIFAAADHAGIEHYFVEHDEPADPIGCITRSFAYLHSLSF